MTLLLLSTLAAGCGGGKGSSSSASSSGGGYGSKAAATTPGGGSATTIKMQNIAFAPAKATVKVGQTVKWVNDDSTAHNVTATAGATFKSDTFTKGGTFEFKPTKAGTIKYVCTLHPGMTAELDVTS